MTGKIAAAKFYFASAISDSMTVGAAGEHNFKVFRGQYLVSRNQGGSFVDTDPNACARKCLDNPLCLSFDAGVIGSPNEGKCYISHDNTATVAGEELRLSSWYNYYERL